MHIFHGYRNWVLIGDKRAWAGSDDEFVVRYWQGSCATCGRPKVISKKIQPERGF